MKVIEVGSRLPKGERQLRVDRMRCTISLYGNSRGEAK